LQYRLNRAAQRFARTDAEVDCQQLWNDMEEIRVYRLSVLKDCSSQLEQQIAEIDASKPSSSQEERKARARKDTLKFELGFLQTEEQYESTLKASSLYHFEQACVGFNH